MCVKSPLIVPGAADFDSVVPTSFRTFSIASTPSTIIATTGPSVMKSNSMFRTFLPCFSMISSV